MDISRLNETLKAFVYGLRDVFLSIGKSILTGINNLPKPVKIAIVILFLALAVIIGILLYKSWKNKEHYQRKAYY